MKASRQMRNQPLELITEKCKLITECRNCRNTCRCCTCCCSARSRRSCRCCCRCRCCSCCSRFSWWSRCCCSRCRCWTCCSCCCRWSGSCYKVGRGSCFKSSFTCCSCRCFESWIISREISCCGRSSSCQSSRNEMRDSKFWIVYNKKIWIKT